MIDTFLMESLEHPGPQRASWLDNVYKEQPGSYGLAVSLGHLQYARQWTGPRTVVTHALTGENGVVTHEIEYVSRDLEALEDQVTRPEVPTRAPFARQPASVAS